MALQEEIAPGPRGPSRQGLVDLTAAENAAKGYYKINAQAALKMPASKRSPWNAVVPVVQPALQE